MIGEGDLQDTLRRTNRAGWRETTAPGEAFGASVVDICWLDDQAAFALGDGSVRLMRGGDDREAETLPLHDGAILALARHPDGRSLLTGGDDGRLIRAQPDGTQCVVLDTGGRWVHQVTADTRSKIIIAAVGSEALVFRPKAEEPRRLAHPSSIGGLALDPKGKRLAVAHYGGVSLWWLNAAADRPEQLEWKGSHLAVSWSPDGRHLMTAMQENMLHGWRLADRAHMRMTGYAGKTRSLSWSAKGKWLLTSGTGAVIAWPFAHKDGPMDRQPMELGPFRRLVTRVTAHPRQEVAVAGYVDGSLRLLHLKDGADMLIETEGDRISALAWSPDGQAFAWGTESGHGGIFAPSSAEGPR